MDDVLSAVERAVLAELRSLQSLDAHVRKARVLAKAGNPEALREWYSSGADGAINWGEHGDFDACVALASEHMDEDQARGFCQLRHQEATGESAGRGAHKAAGWHYAIAKSANEKRFTLGPFYIPDRLDAHNEFVNPEDLQQGIWNYVRKGYRDIHLQHTDRKAGEWVEIVSWPYPTEVDLLVPGDEVRKARVRKESFPQGTAYMGVVWEPWAWKLVKKGDLRGLSMGGFANRVEVEFGKSVAAAAAVGAAMGARRAAAGGGGGLSIGKPPEERYVERLADLYETGQKAADMLAAGDSPNFFQRNFTNLGKAYEFHAAGDQQGFFNWANDLAVYSAVEASPVKLRTQVARELADQVSALQKQAEEKAGSAGGWDESLHPRDESGRFTSKAADPMTAAAKKLGLSPDATDEEIATALGLAPGATDEQMAAALAEKTGVEVPPAEGGAPSEGTPAPSEGSAEEGVEEAVPAEPGVPAEVVPEGAPPEGAPPAAAPEAATEPTPEELIEQEREAKATARAKEMWAGVEAAWDRFLQAQGMTEVTKEEGDGAFLQLLDLKAEEFLVRDAIRWLSTGPTPGRMLEVAALAEEDLTASQQRALLALDGDDAFDLLILGACEVFGDHIVAQAVEQGPESLAEEPDEFEALGEEEGTAEDADDITEVEEEEPGEMEEEPGAEEETEEEPSAETEEEPEEEPEEEEPRTKRPRSPFFAKHGDHDQSSHGKWATGDVEVATMSSNLISASGSYGYGAATPPPSVTREPKAPYSGTDDPHFQSVDAVASLDADLYGAGFEPAGNGRYTNTFGEVVEVKTPKDDEVIVNEYGNDGELVRSSRFESQRDLDNSELRQRLFIESSMMSELNPGEPVLIKAVKGLLAMMRPLPLAKHGDHDQSEHGNWARGGVAESNPTTGFATEQSDEWVHEAAPAGDFPAGDVRNIKPELDDHFQRATALIADNKDLDTQKQFDPDRDGVYAPERQAVHDDIVSDYLDRAADVPAEKVAIIVGGLPGAGKSYALAQHANQLGFDAGSEFITINPDDMKEELIDAGLAPEVPGLAPGELSGLMHEESSDLAKDAASAIIDSGRGTNLIWDITMSSPGSVQSRLDELKDAGYQVFAMYVDTTPHVSLFRAGSRYLGRDGEPGTSDDGRMVDLDMLGSVTPTEEGYTPNRAVFESLKGNFDGHAFIDANGAQPKVIARENFAV